MSKSSSSPKKKPGLTKDTPTVRSPRNNVSTAPSSKRTSSSQGTAKTVADQVIQAAMDLRDAVDKLDFSDSIPWVYNPLQYAWAAHEQYLRKYAQASCRVFFLGMNPGPWGMAQTGVPFGEINAAHQWLEIDAEIQRPKQEHPKRPIEGWSCTRSEVSGERLWGLFRKRYAQPSKFFKQHFVANYCPLVFMEESARNVTPDKLPAALRGPLENICDLHLQRLLEALEPDWVIGVGAWAEKCALRVATSNVKIGKILHPSPASPIANRDWAGTATAQLEKLGIW